MTAIGRRAILPFALLSALMGSSVGVAKFITPLYAIALGADVAQIGLIASGGAIGMLLVSLPIGFMVGHFGPRRLFIAGSALGGIGYALVPFAVSPWGLLVGTTAVGLFMPMRFVALNTAFFEQVRKLGDGQAGWSRAANMSGMFLVGPALGALLAAHVGLQTTWWVVAASFALTIALSPLALSRQVERPTHARSARGFVAGIASLLRDRELRHVNLIDFVSQGTTSYSTTFVIVIALQVFRLPLAAASTLVTAWGAAFVVTLLAGTRLARRFGADRARTVGLLLVATAMVMLGSAGGRWAMVAGVLMQGFGAGLVQLVNLGQVARIGARLGSGRVAGMNLLVGPLGGWLGASLGGLLGQHVGLQAAFFAFVPGYLLLALWQLREHGRAVIAAA